MVAHTKLYETEHNRDPKRLEDIIEKAKHEETPMMTPPFTSFREVVQ
jgi:hypothetical protein